MAHSGFTLLDQLHSFSFLRLMAFAKSPLNSRSPWYIDQQVSEIAAEDKLKEIGMDSKSSGFVTVPESEGSKTLFDFIPRRSILKNPTAFNGNPTTRTANEISRKRGRSRKRRVIPSSKDVKSSNSNITSGSEETSTMTNDTDEFQTLRTKVWVEENIRKLGNNQEDEEMKYKVRMQGLLKIRPEEYQTVLQEIQLVREKEAQKQKEIQIEKGKNDMESEAEIKKNLQLEKAALEQEFSWDRIKPNGFRKRCSMLWAWGIMKLIIFYKEHLFYQTLKNAGFYTPHWSVFFHNGSCMATLTCAIIILILGKEEIRELQRTFRNVDSSVSNRTISIVSAIFVLVGAIFGIIGTYFKKGHLIYAYILCFIFGWTMFVSNEIHEKSYSSGTSLEEFLILEVMEYMKDSGKDRQFLSAIQTEFRCCGAHGPSDYGFNGTLTPGVQVDLPPSCCHTRSYKYEKLGFTECFISPNVEPELQIFVNYEGCVETTKFYLLQLYKIKEPLYIFMVFVTFTTVMSFINLSFHFFDIGSKGKIRRLNLTPGEMFMEAVEDKLLENENVEMNKIPGSMTAIRERLSECKNLSEFVAAILDMIREVDFVIYADPEDLAREILGLPSRKINDPQSVMSTSNPLNGEKPKQDYAKIDVKFKFLTQYEPLNSLKQLDPQSQLLLPNLNYLTLDSSMDWNRVVRKLQRNKMIAKENEIKPGLWKRIFRKVVPGKEKLLTDMEEEQELEVLTRVIAESQVLLRNLHRKNYFLQKIDHNPLKDCNNVNETVKLLAKTEDLHKFNPTTNRLVLKNLISHKILTSNQNPSPKVREISTQPYSSVADHKDGSNRIVTQRPHEFLPDAIVELTTIAVQTDELLISTSSIYQDVDFDNSS